MNRIPRWLLLCAAALALPLPSPAAPASPPLSERVGFSHVNCCYGFTDEPIMIEGARRILEIGSRVIKLWLTPETPNYYARNDKWPEYKTLVELAQAPSFKKVFDMPFKTYILETYPPGRDGHYWREGVPESRRRQEVEEFEALATHFLTAYKGTGKTFVLQHWEGDWAISGKPGDRTVVPPETAVQGMIDWLHARQEGVDRARRKAPNAGCRVYHAAEVNLIDIALDGKKHAIVDTVIPRTNCDLYSYSSYDTSIPRTRFKQALEYLAARAPDSAAFGDKNIFIGEYGIPENEFRDTFQAVIDHNTRTALDFGCRWVVYWQLYDNECKSRPAANNADCRGFWLIRQDGSKSWAYEYFEKMLKGKR